MCEFLPNETVEKTILHSGIVGDPTFYSARIGLGLLGLDQPSELVDLADIVNQSE